MKSGALQLTPPSDDVYIAIPSVWKGLPWPGNGSAARKQLPRLSQAIAGSDMPAHALLGSGSPSSASGGASRHDSPPAKVAYAAIVKSYAAGLVKRLDAPAMLSGLSGLASSSDSLRALFGLELLVPWVLHHT